MKRVSPKEVFENYKKRFTFYPEYGIQEPPYSELQFVIVIPCHNEKDLLHTLNSLISCEAPFAQMEVIVIVNNAVNAEVAIQEQNRKTLEDFKNWKLVQDSPLRFYAIEATDLSPKKSGVGLARKIGMDLAAQRFAQLDKYGWIINLDADCLVSKNYLTSIENRLNGKVRGGHFYFEHNLDKVADEALKIGITLYELHLRYYAQALKYAGFKYWHHTVGSCMITRSDVYLQQGGMNQRKAGEDFYYMHKIRPGGHCIEINDAAVYPSARVSDRVPFGTGKAQGDWLQSESNKRLTYSFEIFKEAKLFFSSLEDWFIEEPNLSEKLMQFLETVSFKSQVDRIRKRSVSKASFLQNLQRVCDGFFTLKMVHYLRDSSFGEQDVVEASNWLLEELASKPSNLNALELLQEFRRLDRNDETT